MVSLNTYNKKAENSYFILGDYKNTEIKAIKMQYIVLNQAYLRNIISSDENKQVIENHRLIPKIDENGNI